MQQKDLFNRLVALLTEVEVLKEDIKAAKSDFTYDEDDNPKGFSKDDIKLITKSAAYQVKANFEEAKSEANAVFAKFEELTGYND